MDKERTRLIDDPNTQEKQTTTGQQKKSEFTTQKSGKKGPKPTKGEPIIATAMGVAVGAGIGIAAATRNNTEELLEGIENETKDLSGEPTSHQSILADDEGLRYAHVDADNFNDAFAQARQQVGPGGIFEYNGQIYGTYYADEWENMSSQEKAEFQNHINGVIPSDHSGYDTADFAADSENEDVASGEFHAGPQTINAEPVDSEIHILGVEAVHNENGQIMNMALVECEGDKALLVDVDNNGTIDVLIHDDNGDGVVQESEVYDVSGEALINDINSITPL